MNSNSKPNLNSNQGSRKRKQKRKEKRRRPRSPGLLGFSARQRTEAQQAASPARSRAAQLVAQRIAHARAPCLPHSQPLPHGPRTSATPSTVSSSPRQRPNRPSTRGRQRWQEQARGHAWSMTLSPCWRRTHDRATAPEP